LLLYAGMPRAAQFLPGAADLAGESGIDLDVRQCSGCGLVQLANDPVPYYREVVRAAAFSGDMREFRRRQFAAWAQGHGLAQRRVVEIGCGRGEYLALLQEAGVEAYGIEYGEASVAECVRRGLKVSRAFVGSADAVLEHAPFAAFVCLNYLEHLPDPGATLRGICRNLAPGGAGLLEVPNLDMILRQRLFAEFACDHLTYFCRATLATLLDRSGFEVLSCDEIWHAYILSAVVRRRAPLDLSDFQAARERLQRQFDDYLRRFPSGSVAIWGAGHQAFAAMALMGLAGRVRYVVDSAPFKQGKYTPATHIPIVAPDALRSDPVAAVVVMAGGYSEEVAAVLRRDYPGTGHVAILRETGLEEIAGEQPA
jgi:SAM-dependent methyltransferase